MDIELAQALEENAELKDQLTKAKEIIKTILGFMQTFGYSPSMDKFVTEAEQFLIWPDDRFEVTKKGKEYLSSH